MTRWPWTVPAVLSMCCALVAQDAPPITAAEAAGFTRTSTLAEVRTFLDALREQPGGERVTIAEFGRSQEDRELLWVRVDMPTPTTTTPTSAHLMADRPRVLVVANIHGGEVCGKEAVQLLLREIVAGEHDTILGAIDLAFVPIYNVDGNEKSDPANRSNCNGPVEGVGERPNGQGFDLNRDCIKTESPEFRALLGLFKTFDPHLLMDLHTTNGSLHAYHLTYASPLSTNTDPTLDRFLRDSLLPETRAAAAERHGYRLFDYGNFGDGDQHVFETFDHRPRFLTNYYGLRNRLGVLSEAYSYEPFEVRVRATRAFVLETLRFAAGHGAAICELCDAADRRTRGGDGVTFGWDTALEDGVEQPILVGACDTVPLPGRMSRIVRRSEFRAVPMLTRLAFRSASTAPLPAGGWAVLEPTAAVQDILAAHGVEAVVLDAPRTVSAAAFEPTSGDKSRREFQGHREIRLRGDWREATEVTLPVGTLLVPSRQSLARLAAQFLEPLSEDGLVTWNQFEAQTVMAMLSKPGAFPVLRLE